MFSFYVTKWRSCDIMASPLLEHSYLYIGKAREQLKVQLDYHLVHTEYKSSMWHQLLGQHHFRAENIADLMELIYFLWFEARQLTRAANMLSKVLHLLVARDCSLQRGLHGISSSLQLVFIVILMFRSQSSSTSAAHCMTHCNLPCMHVNARSKLLQSTASPVQDLPCRTYGSTLLPCTARHIPQPGSTTSLLLQTPIALIDSIASCCRC